MHPAVLGCPSIHACMPAPGAAEWRLKRQRTQETAHLHQMLFSGTVRTADLGVKLEREARSPASSACNPSQRCFGICAVKFNGTTRKPLLSWPTGICSHAERTHGMLFTARPWRVSRPELKRYHVLLRVLNRRQMFADCVPRVLGAARGDRGEPARVRCQVGHAQRPQGERQGPLWSHSLMLYLCAAFVLFSSSHSCAAGGMSITARPRQNIHFSGKRRA